VHLGVPFSKKVRLERSHMLICNASLTKSRQESRAIEMDLLASEATSTGVLHVSEKKHDIWPDGVGR
jgi:hypothetical protein